MLVHKHSWTPLNLYLCKCAIISLHKTKNIGWNTSLFFKYSTTIWYQNEHCFADCQIGTSPSTQLKASWEMQLS